MKRIEGPGFEVQVPPEWERIAQPGDAFTLANPSGGVGALQLSIAADATDEKPTVMDLRDVIQGLAETNQLGAPTDISYFDLKDLRCAVSTFRQGDDFIRVWSVSDGKSFALATYVCRQGSEQQEVETADLVVRSIVFSPTRVA